MNLAAAILIGAGTLLLVGCHRASVQLPYDRTNPVVYDNDSAVDVYTDEYLLALASLGEIQLKGMLTSSSVVPENKWVKVEDYESEVANRQRLTDAARASGLRNVPTPVRGPMGMLQKPASARIEDTKPIDSDGTRLLIDEARKCTPERPLAVIVGGPLTAEASAYLLDPSIADKMVIGWLSWQNHDMGNYNGWADPWAAYITLQKLRLVQFGDVRPARVLKTDLAKLPSSSFQKFMYDAYLPSNPPGPGDYDGDGPPAIALMRPDYCGRAKSVSFGHFKIEDGHEIPAFRRDLLTLTRRGFNRVFGVQQTGRVIVVSATDETVATNEWWRAIRAALGVTATP